MVEADERLESLGVRPQNFHFSALFVARFPAE
jgi:hypothetical protein